MPMPSERSAPARLAADITPHDTTALTYKPRGIYIGGGGTLKVTMIDGGTVTFNGLVAGQFLPITPTIVFSTGTSATNLIGLYGD